MGVLAVGDEAADDTRLSERRADDARRARSELAHGVIEMGDRSRAGAEDALGLLGARVGMAEADHDPGLGQARDPLERDRDRSERDDHDARARADQRVGVAVQHRADEFGRMHALAPPVDERPFDMDAERARNAILRLRAPPPAPASAPAAHR